MTKILMIAAFLSFIPCISSADVQGTYQMASGDFVLSLTIQSDGAGKYFFNGSGSLADGRTCRIGDLATVNGGQAQFPSCSAAIKEVDGGIELNDQENCFSCKPGLSATGTYVRK